MIYAALFTEEQYHFTKRSAMRLIQCLRGHWGVEHFYCHLFYQKTANCPISITRPFDIFSAQDYRRFIKSRRGDVLLVDEGVSQIFRGPGPGHLNSLVGGSVLWNIKSNSFRNIIVRNTLVIRPTPQIAHYMGRIGRRRNAHTTGT